MKNEGKNKKLWMKIRLEYESTETSFERLSKIYPFSKNWIAKVAKRDGWKKFKYIKKEIEEKAKEQFILESSITVQELMVAEDKALGRLQEVVEGKVPYQEIFKNLETLGGDLIVKIDGTVKGITETAMLIGNKRRELRGVLPLKDRKILALKEEELNHKKEMDLAKLQLDKERQELNKKEKELIIKDKELELKIKKLELEPYLNNK